MKSRLRKDLEDQRTEAAWQLGNKPAKYQRDIVDMFHDDGLTPKEALEAERQAQARADSKAYRQELADDFRKAIEALPPMPDKTCDWCGADLYKDHKVIDRDFLMCNPCHAREDPAWRQYVTEAYSRPMHEGEMER